MKRWVPASVALIVLAAGGFALCPGGRLTAESVALLAEVWAIGRGDFASGPAGAPLSHEYEGPDGTRRVADLYCPDPGPPRARLLLVHGLIESGRGDTRLHALGRAFARRGFLVMVPDFPGMRALRAGRGDIGEVRAAIGTVGRLRACAGGPEGPSGAGRPARALPTGVVGFSYSAGPVLLAIDRRPPGVEFAVLFGGYYDLAEVLLFLTTGRHRDGAAEYEGETLPQGRWVLLAANAGTIADPADRGALIGIARRRIADPEAPIDDLLPALHGPSRALLDLVMNSDPARFEPLLRAAGPDLRKVLDDLSPSRSLSGPLDVDLYLLHGRSDVVVPYTQSLKMSREVSTSGSIRLALLGGFRHARPDGTAGEPWWSSAARHPGDSIRLLGIIREILTRRASPSTSPGESAFSRGAGPSSRGAAG
ncbi:MAG: alpha/beta hydrolase family protein [Acidobacteriota bacterium]